jgi:hypothetical protein
MIAIRRLLSAIPIALFVAYIAPTHADGPGWVYNRTVVQVVNTANGGFNVRVSPDVTGCTSQSGYGQIYASVYPDHPGLNRLKADVLTAFVTGKPISFYLYDNTCRVVETVLGVF